MTPLKALITTLAHLNERV